MTQQIATSGAISLISYLMPFVLQESGTKMLNNVPDIQKTHTTIRQKLLVTKDNAMIEERASKGHETFLTTLCQKTQVDKDIYLNSSFTGA